MHEEECRLLAVHRVSRAGECLEESRVMLENNKLNGAANRVYYAVFNCMRAVLSLENADYSSHKGVISHFQREYIKTGVFEKDFAVLIRMAESFRHDSDYKDYFVPDREELVELIEKCADFCIVIEAYCK